MVAITLSLVALNLMGNTEMGRQVRVSSLTGDIRKIPHFTSKILGNQRNISVYLPPNYNQDQNQRYPVLYAQDGQNVFDGATSFIPNKEWRLDEAAEALIKTKLIPPIIIVAIDNAGSERADEYLPTRFKLHNSPEMIGGRADLYARMLLEELKPTIDKMYRTKPDRDHTGLIGSSLGAIVTLYLGMTHPDSFSKLAVVSPSIWVDDRLMLKKIISLKSKLDLRIWTDIGTLEGTEAVTDAQDFVKALENKGWRLGRDLVFYQDGFAAHNEEAWSRRVPAILTFLFGHR